jgi:hypothetical protein
VSGQRFLSFACPRVPAYRGGRIFVATLVPRRELRLLDLTELLEEGLPSLKVFKAGNL